MRGVHLLFSLSLCSFFVFNQYLSDRVYASEHPMEARYLEDPENRINIDSALITLTAGRFQSLPEDRINFKFTNAAYWIQLIPTKSDSERVLVIENAHLDYVDFYLFAEGEEIRRLHSGDRVSFSNRDFDLNFINIIIPIEVDFFLIKVRSEGKLLVPANLYSQKDFYDDHLKNIRFHYFFLGVLFLVFVVTLFLIVAFNERIYYLYLLALLSFFVLSGMDFGYLFQYLYPNSPSINRFNSAFYCVHVFVIVFTKAYLRLYLQKKAIDHIFQLLILSYVLIFITGIFGNYTFALQAVNVFSLLSPLVVIGVLFYCYFVLHIKSSIFIFLGWAGHLLSIVLYLFTTVSILPFNAFTKNLLPMGATVEIVFFFIAFAQRLNQLKVEKENILSNQKQVLEEELKVRTREINDKNEELSEQNSELLKQKEELQAQGERLERQKTIIEKQNVQLNNLNIFLEDKVEKKTRDLLRLTRDLEIKNTRLEHFAYVLSHNIRAPYASLKGLLSILDRKSFATQQNYEVLHKIDQTILTMGNILKDASILLNISIERDPEIENVNVKDVLASAFSKLNDKIENTNAIVENRLTESIMVKSIPSYLANIFYQILDNAIKFHKPNELPTIEIGVDRGHKKKNYVVIILKDNGMGIDPLFLSNKLFHPFQKAHNEKEGNGMGLFIAKIFADAINARILFDSKLQEGTAVYLYLPI